MHIRTRVGTKLQGTFELLGSGASRTMKEYLWPYMASLTGSLESYENLEHPMP
jgi:hypothetical protein